MVLLLFALMTLNMFSSSKQLREFLILYGEGGQPTPVFLPGEPHGQRSLVGYSPWGRRS